MKAALRGRQTQERLRDATTPLQRPRDSCWISGTQAPGNVVRVLYGDARQTSAPYFHRSGFRPQIPETPWAHNRQLRNLTSFQNPVKVWRAVKRTLLRVY